MEASWEREGGFRVGCLRLKRDKPVPARIRRSRVQLKDPGGEGVLINKVVLRRNNRRKIKPALVPSSSHSRLFQDQVGTELDGSHSPREVPAPRSS